MNAVLLVFASISLQQAEAYPAPGPGYYGAYYRPGGSTTVAGSHMEGMSSMISSAGQANLQNSIAAGNYQEAYSKYLDNSVKTAQTYYDRKNVWEQQKYARDQKRQAERLAYIQRHPPQLRPSHSELDPVTGDIRWPMLLRMNDFNDHRDKLGKLFEERAARGDLTYEEHREVQQTVATWRDELKENRSKYPYDEYADAVKFIQRLGREVDNPVS
jgi:hypothetical protein